MGSASVAVHLELRSRLCHSRPAATPRGSIRAANTSDRNRSFFHHRLTDSRCTTALGCIFCDGHGLLAKARPGPAYLTEFFIWLSLGGVLGSIFAGLIAPLSFDTVFEYPLLLALACALRPGAGSRAEHGVRRCIAQILDFGVLYLSGLHLLHTRMPLNDVLQFGFFVSAGLILYFTRNRPLRLAIALLIVFMPAYLISSALVLHQERSYFGVHRVVIGESGQVPVTDARHHRARGRASATGTLAHTAHLLFSGGTIGAVL